MTTPPGLHQGFLESCERHPDRPALEVDGATYSYAQLRDRAASFAATLTSLLPSCDPPLTAVFAYRSATAYAGVLGALLRGHGYVPLNPMFPSDRTRTMLERSGAEAIIVDATAAAQLDKVLQGVERRLTILLPDQDPAELRARWPLHRFVGKDELVSGAGWTPPALPAADAIAYILFTSGSTGMPKGVVVSHANGVACVRYLCKRYAPQPTDRFSQMFEMVFDLSVYDMFVTWTSGACLCVPSRAQLLTPGKYIKDAGLTMWFSVPSVGVLMKRLRLLDPGSYPSLRYVLFCGEALTAENVLAWEQAAPNATIENLYGPTELTVACTLYRWRPGASANECENGLVPIGEPFDDMQVLVANERYEEVPPGEAGELLMTGPQLSLGYWKDPDKTAAAFVKPPGRDEVFYRTGDLVRRPKGNEPLLYLGRIDHQIKIHGSRVELGEIEAVLREITGSHTAVALGWPLNASGADGIVAFIAPSSVSFEELKEKAKKRLPAYMIPREVRQVTEFPLNSNGKVDRKALQKILSGG